MITKFQLYEYLNSSKGKSIGSGGYGEVFDYVGNPNLVIKLTADKSEYESAKKLIGQKTNYIVRYYEAEPESNKYLLVMDKIDTVLSDTYNKILDELNIYCYDYDEDFYYSTLFDEEEMEFIIEEYSDEYPEKDVKFVIKQLQEIVKECKKYNITTNDFHSKNIGQKDDHFVFFDVGAMKSI